MNQVSQFAGRLLLTLFALGALAGCSTTPNKTADAADSKRSLELSSSIRTSLDQAGLKDVSASHNRTNGMVTLTGQVQAEGEKSQAESIAKSLAGGHDVSNQISVMPMAEGRMGNHGRGHMGDHGGERKPEPPR